jgi:hypothetical protein
MRLSKTNNSVGRCNEQHLTSLSAVRVISLFRLNRSDSNFGWFVSWRDRSDPAAHAKHYVPSYSKKKVVNEKD